MRLRSLIILHILLYTIILNNAIKIFAETENLSAAEIAAMDMSTPENTAEVSPARLDENGEPLIAAKSAVVMDAKTGLVVWGKEEHAHHFPASVTKILTSLIACEETSPEDLVTFSDEAVYGIGEDSSSIAVRVGETLNMEQCLHAMLMASANDVCVGVAEFIDGSIDKFAERMNRRAKELGAEDSHFANPHGYHDVNHYTTAYDMAMILREAIKQPRFIESYSCLSYTIPKTNMVDEERILHPRAQIIVPDSKYYYEYIKGSKTGYTSEAGNTLISYAEKDGIELICCVLADRDTNTYTDTALLFDYGFGRYETKQLISPGELSREFPVNQIYNDRTIDLGKVTASVKTVYSAVLPDFVNKDNVKFVYDVPDTISGGITAGKAVGKVNIVYQGITLGSAELTADYTIETIPENTLMMWDKIKLCAFFVGTVAFIIILIIIIYNVTAAVKKIRRRRRRRNRLKPLNPNRHQRPAGSENKPQRKTNRRRTSGRNTERPVRRKKRPPQD